MKKEQDSYRGTDSVCVKYATEADAPNLRECLALFLLECDCGLDARLRFVERVETGLETGGRGEENDRCAV